MGFPLFATVPPIRPNEPLVQYAARIGVHRSTVFDWKRTNKLRVARPDELLLANVVEANDAVAQAALGGLLQNRITEIQAELLLLHGQLEAKLKSVLEVQDRIERREREYRQLTAAHLVLGKENGEMEAAKEQLRTEIEALLKQRTVLTTSTREIRRASIFKELEDPVLRGEVLERLLASAPKQPVEPVAPAVPAQDPMEVLRAALGETRMMTFTHLLKEPGEYAGLYTLFLAGGAVEAALGEWGRTHSLSREELGFLSDALREWKAAGVPGYLLDRRGPRESSDVSKNGPAKALTRT
jgi:hypothetical protein